MNYMLLGDRYELLEKVGEGGMAIVYKARDRKLNRFVAVKVLKDSFKENEEIIRKFKKEAQAIATLSDPNIVNVLDVGNQNDINYIVMEFIEGKTLKKIIQEKGHLPNDVAIRIAIKVASALGCAHKNNIVHRDIKPHNILVTAEGIVKVTDFGIAKSMDSSTLAHTNTIMGSAHYFSPEQAKGSYIDFRTDIYSLGVVLYEMVTGKVPFDGDSAVTVALKHIQELAIPPMEINPEVSESLNRLILKCMSKDPNERYESVVDLKIDLERIKDNPNVIIDTKNEEDSDYTRVMSPVSLDDTIYQNTDSYSNEDNDDEDEYEDDEEYEEYDEFEDEKDNGRKRKGATGLIVAIIVIVVVCGGIYVGAKLGGSKISNQKVQIPSIVNEASNQAETTLEQLGFKVTIVQQESNEAVGTVLSTNPAVGSEVAKGSTITIYVSSGPGAITIQDLSTMTPSAAQQALQNEGLVVGNITYAYSDSISKGQVIGTSPAAGNQVAKGSTVNIIVSKGQQVQMVNVPNLSGMTVTEATQALSGVGLQINAVQGNNAGLSADNGKIYAQNPAEGYSVEAGTTVTVTYYGNYVEETTPPATVPDSGTTGNSGSNNNSGTTGNSGSNNSNSETTGNNGSNSNNSGTTENSGSNSNDSGTTGDNHSGSTDNNNNSTSGTDKKTDQQGTTQESTPSGDASGTGSGKSSNTTSTQSTTTSKQSTTVNSKNSTATKQSAAVATSTNTTKK